MSGLNANMESILFRENLAIQPGFAFEEIMVHI